MNLAEQLESLEARGFDQERAQTVVLIREAAILLFEAFPDSFLLYGGANLILFHNSVRTSRDLDLLSHGVPLPSAEKMANVLSLGLEKLGELLNVAPLTIRIDIAESMFVKLSVLGPNEQSFFTVDMGGLGSVLASGIEEHALEAVSQNSKTTIKSVSRDHQLLQKAEAFMFRRAVKTRDAYDIKILLDSGAKLAGELRNHLSDSLLMNELNDHDIAGRIQRITAKLCQAELKGVLPTEVYEPLERAEFQPLREALKTLFEQLLRD
jgi:Nucleotidyl transferase AbiEii toxin, Type IV TA system